MCIRDRDGAEVVGARTRVKVVKNKMAPPFKEVEFDILYGEGISKEGDLLDLATNMNIVEKSGTWYTYKDERIGQGRENARQWLKDNASAMDKIRAEVLAKAGIGVKKEAAATNNPQTAPAGATVAGKPGIAASAQPAGAKAAPSKK